MIKNKFINKIAFNFAVISDTLLAGIILCNNYHIQPDIVMLTITSITTSGYLLSQVKLSSKTLKK